MLHLMVWFENANFTTVELYYSRRSIVNVRQNANWGQLWKQFEGPSAWQAWICTLCNGTVVRSDVRLCRNKHHENKLVQTRTRQTLSCGDSYLQIYNSVTLRERRELIQTSHVAAKKQRLEKVRWKQEAAVEEPLRPNRFRGPTS